MNFTAGNLFPSHSCIWWPESIPHQDSNPDPQLERQTTYQNILFQVAWPVKFLESECCILWSEKGEPLFLCGEMGMFPTDLKEHFLLLPLCSPSLFLGGRGGKAKSCHTSTYEYFSYFNFCPFVPSFLAKLFSLLFQFCNITFFKKQIYCTPLPTNN